MTSKERILAALRGKAVDKVPFSPFLAYWWEFQPEELKQQGQYNFMKSVGADPILRGFEPMFNLEFAGCETVERCEGIKKYVEHRTPKGSLYLEYSYVKSSDTWFLTKHPIEQVEQLELFKSMVDGAKITPNYKAYSLLTDDGKADLLFMPIIGMFHKTAFQSLLEHWIGTENLVYMLYDDEKAVMDTLELMWDKDAVTVDISAKSPASAFIFWEDSSTTNINPNIFKKCTAPQITAWANQLHKTDKLLVHHACGHINDLIVPMAETGIDVIESITPFPTGNITMEDAFKKLPDNIALVGGIDPVFLLDSTLDELDVYIRNLLKITKDKRFVLANSDSCPPGVEIEKFRLIAQIVRDFKA